jgi:transcriptional regulator with AAA-type ATPase domain
VYPIEWRRLSLTGLPSQKTVRTVFSKFSASKSCGEGKEKTFDRLQKEVEAFSAAPCIIPFSQNDRLVGQQSQLAEIETMLFTGKYTIKIAIAGEGGTGKSQLALKLAYRQ